MAIAVFRHGAQLNADYTPTADTPAGTVIDRNGTAGITHLDIKADTLGAIDAGSGNGVYELTKASAATVFALGDVVKSDSSGEAVATGGTGIVVGSAAAASANGDAVVWVILNG